MIDNDYWVIETRNWSRKNRFPNGHIDLSVEINYYCQRVTRELFYRTESWEEHDSGDGYGFLNQVVQIV